MKKDIILSGVGGQGILSIATVIGEAAIAAGLHLKQAEVHGMSQRGGDVQSHLRLSDKPIFSDLIPRGQADLIIAMEPMEALRYVQYLHPNAWIVTASEPFVNIPNYPDSATLKRIWTLFRMWCPGISKHSQKKRPCPKAPTWFCWEWPRLTLPSLRLNNCAPPSAASSPARRAGCRGQPESLRSGADAARQEIEPES